MELLQTAEENEDPLMLTVRVYGVLRDSANRILVSDEFIRGGYYTKFPGGGLELGEGTRDCLKREFMEETRLHVTIGEHLYTTDFYQPSAFREGQQILSIYYWVTAEEPILLETKNKPFDFAPSAIANPDGEAELFRWINWEDFNEDTVTLPIDKVVARMVKNSWRLDVG